MQLIASAKRFTHNLYCHKSHEAPKGLCLRPQDHKCVGHQATAVVSQPSWLCNCWFLQQLHLSQLSTPYMIYGATLQCKQQRWAGNPFACPPSVLCSLLMVACLTDDAGDDQSHTAEDRH